MCCIWISITHKQSTQQQSDDYPLTHIIKNCVITLSLNPAVFVHFFSKMTYSCADPVSERGSACIRFSIIMEISRLSATLPCGINSLTGTHVRPYLRQHRNDDTHPNSPCDVLLMKTNHTAAVMMIEHGTKEQQDYCATVLANTEKPVKSEECKATHPPSSTYSIYLP